jgi:hypothetical protein
VRLPFGSPLRACVIAALWTLALSGAFLCVWLASTPSPRHAGEVGYAFLAALLALAPFTVFAGGASVFGPEEGRVRRWIYVLLAWAGLAWVGGAYLEPIADFRLVEDRVLAPDAPIREYLPDTPGMLKRWRSDVVAHPPKGYSLDRDRPLERPPNFLTLQIHEPAATAVFLFLNGLVGLAVARRVPGRGSRKALLLVWVWGLVSALGTFGLRGWAVSTLVRDPTGSGPLHAWGPTLVWAVLLLLLWPRRRGAPTP